VTILGFLLVVFFVPARLAEVKIEELGVTRISPVNEHVERLLLKAIKDEIMKDGILTSAKAIRNPVRTEFQDPQAVSAFFGDANNTSTTSEPVCEAGSVVFADGDAFYAFFDDASKPRS